MPLKAVVSKHNSDVIIFDLKLIALLSVHLKTITCEEAVVQGCGMV